MCLFIFWCLVLRRHGDCRGDQGAVSRSQRRGRRGDGVRFTAAQPRKPPRRHPVLCQHRGHRGQLTRQAQGVFSSGVENVLAQTRQLCLQHQRRAGLSSLVSRVPRKCSGWECRKIGMLLPKWERPGGQGEKCNPPYEPLLLRNGRGDPRTTTHQVFKDQNPEMIHNDLENGESDDAPWLIGYKSRKALLTISNKDSINDGIKR